MKFTKRLNLIALAAALLICSSSFAQKISAGEKALAMWEVQNVMSRHAYYHSLAINLKEVNDLWVAADGPNAKTARFTSPAFVMNGLSTIKRAYGEENEQRKKDALEKLSKISDVENTPENIGAGYEWVIHTNTTPIIVIADDGKTAKGMWYSPGIGLMADLEGEKPKANGTFFWEKYAVDFIKEDGRWKIWHMQMVYDYTPKLNGDWLDFSDKGGAEAGERGDLPEGFSEPEYSYPAYSPERAATMYPKLPEPYATFSETFSY